MDGYNISERTACSLVGLSRAAYRYMPLPRDDEEPLRAEVIRMASTYGRYGYRFIAGMMRNAGWGQATTAKVARIWRQEGLKIPQKQAPRGRLWLNDGSCMRLRATHPNHVWSYVPQGFPLVILSLSEMLMGARSACSRWLMNTPESA